MTDWSDLIWIVSSASGSQGGNCVEVAFVKSTYSNPSGNCVEVALGNDEVLVRDTKDKGEGPVLRFTGAEWDAFLTGAEGGEFNRPRT